MFRITRVLCATDFSAQSQVALPFAFALARDHDAALVLLYVRPAPKTLVGEFGLVIPQLPEPIEPLKARLRKCVSATYEGAVEICIADGDAAEEILDTAQKQHCDVIVLGTHGRSGLSRLLLGSVAEAVLRRSPCPVVTIKPSKMEPAIEPAESEVEPNIDANELIAVCTAANAVDAEVIRNALNAEGIGCFIEGTNQAGLAGTLGIPISITVRTTDSDRARKLIRNHEVCRD